MNAVNHLKELVGGARTSRSGSAHPVPQGGEKQLIQAITGRQVPPGCLPMWAAACSMRPPRQPSMISGSTGISG